ncbi:putative merozoite capping protein-1 [Erysiphe neolycopersici]|uniref:thioredoxin-dependent peroxiredoxin n=1 Tax=Erysiphe neolycopersici TaxID=212602 RepID=A0A420HW01_9PEZI|nr:putative merozoite capping protein-1 [Erysiphe neolycopersici]
MPSVLRKRKSPAAQPAAVESTTRKKKRTETGKASAKLSNSRVSSPSSDKSQEDEKVKTKSTPSSRKIAVGDIITLKGFGGEIETHEGVKTTLLKLVDESKNGVVIFTYPKASTPGCTTQACLFRDQYGSLTSTGFSIYGLSKDSTKANTNFKSKQNLPYPLLCDPRSTLIKAIGLSKAPSGITRGVFVINKHGKVLVAQAGGPAATVKMVKSLVESNSTEAEAETSAVVEESSSNLENVDEESSKPTETDDKKDT